MNSNFMYGIGAVKYKNKEVGYIAKGSFDMGGTKPESTDIEAEQVPGAPVLVIPQSNGKIAPKFDMIQLNFETLHQLLGGALHKSADKVVGWTAPRDAMVMEGPWELALVSGQSVLIPAANFAFRPRRQADTHRDRQNRGRAEGDSSDYCESTSLRCVRFRRPPR